MSENVTLSWKASFTIHASKVEPLNDFIDWPIALATTPTLSCFEIEDTENWLVEIFIDTAPTQKLQDELAQFLSEMCGHDITPLQFEAIIEQDWVAQSQALRVPILAGRFLCVADHHDQDQLDINGKTIITMDAGQAFGTGSHETTYGCLLALDHLAEKISPKTILDLGTGTGLLAIAAKSIWPVYCLATDNDPIAIEVTNENIAINKLPPHAIDTLVSEGFEKFNKSQKFNLIIANILANPLIELAPDIAHHISRKGTLILSGILNEQANKVVRAYKQQGFKLAQHNIYKNWSVLILNN